MDGLRELIHRVGVDSGSMPAHAKETGPSNFDGGGVEDRLRFLKKLDRLAARLASTRSRPNRLPTCRTSVRAW
jgi:hypothetical protein